MADGVDKHDEAHHAALKLAVDLAKESVSNGGGPFGAVIVKSDTGEVVARGNNRVVMDSDPSAHAEVVAIRNAGKAIKDNVLKGFTLYTSTEPCPMCLTATYWARLDKIVYASDRHDAAAAGFDDAFFYEEVGKPHSERAIPISRGMGGKELGAQAFEAWAAKEDRVHY